MTSPRQSRRSDVALALLPPPASQFAATVRKAALGLTAFGAYVLTDLATLRGYTVAIEVMDMTQGSFATVTGAGAGPGAGVRAIQSLAKRHRSPG